MTVTRCDEYGCAFTYLSQFRSILTRIFHLSRNKSSTLYYAAGKCLTLTVGSIKQFCFRSVAAIIRNNYCFICCLIVRDVQQSQFRSPL